MTSPSSFRFALAATCALALPAAWGHGNEHDKRPAAFRAVETAFGRSAPTERAGRTVQVRMSDTMRFVPDNDGKAMHEMVIGRHADLKAHAALMRKFPGMEHDEPYMAHVPPGKTATFAWQFSQAGEFHYGCLVPGHFEAGMVGRITVR